MVATTTQDNNKLVRFRGRAQHELAGAYKRGLISDKALRRVKKKHRKFAQKAAHNPPKPTHAAPDAGPSAVEKIARPVAEAAERLGEFIGKEKKPKAGASATLGIRG